MSWSSPTVVPMRGWNTRSVTSLRNPRTPAVPATLDLTLEEYYAAAAVVGLLSAQLEEPDMEWVVTWASDFGERMARESRTRRDKRRPRPHKV
jgi:hypothetical protein